MTRSNNCKELLRQCFTLLADKGYANVTTRQLAQLLNISTGAWYHYFLSKKALFEQLVEEMSQQDVRMLQAVAAGDKTLSQRISLLGELLIEQEDYVVKQAALFVDFYRQTDRAEILSSSLFGRIDQQYQQVMMTVLGLSEPKLARFAWTLINGVLIVQAEGETGFSFAEQINLLTDMLTAYFEKHGT